jgi:hypothetical protein
MGLQLLKYDAKHGFDGFQVNPHLVEIVKSSTLKIYEGTSNDWETQHNAIKSLIQSKTNNLPSSNLGFLFIAQQTDPNLLLPQMKIHFGSGLSN